MELRPVKGREKACGMDLKLRRLERELRKTVARVVGEERLLISHVQEMEMLFGALRRRLRQLERVDYRNLSVLKALIHILEAKDHYTRGHSMRVAEYTVRLAVGMGLDRYMVEKLHLAAVLHDLGKIAVPGEILNKAGPLGSEEFALIKQHPDLGVKILQALAPAGELLPLVRHHHERYDGSGYPAGLKGESIPLGARIIALADSFDAMTSDRVYRPALPVDAALAEIKRMSGTQFAPELVFKWLALYSA